jgi:hypothetical protein
MPLQSPSEKYIFHETKEVRHFHCAIERCMCALWNLLLVVIRGLFSEQYPNNAALAIKDFSGSTMIRSNPSKVH